MTTWLAVATGVLGLTLSVQSPRVLVVGIDGGDWHVIDPLVDSGHLPTLAGLLEDSARADLNCRPAHPTFSCFCPPVWTTIVTGQPFSVHRILGVHDRSSRRRAPAIWEVNRARGGLSTLVSIRGSWPPERDAGFVLTEPGLDSAAGEIYDRWWTPQHPGLSLPASHTHPIGLFETLGLLPHSGERPPAWQMFARDRIAMSALTRLERLQWRWLRSARRRAGRGGAADALTPADAGRSNLVLIILHGVDRAEHMGWSRVQPERNGPVEPDLVVGLAERWSGPVFDPPPWGWGSAVSQYLEADAWLGEHLAEFDYDAVVLVSDHGMGRNNVPGGAPGHHGSNVPDAHTGIFAVRAEGIRAGSDLGEMSVLDVAPTLAYLLGLPVATLLPGRPIFDAFASDWLGSHPVEWTPTW